MYAAFGAVLLVPVAGVCLTGVRGLEPVLKEIRDEYYLDTDNPAVDIREQFIVYAKDGKRAKEVLAVDPKTLSAETIALRFGSSRELGTDRDNLLRRASFKQDSTSTALRIDVPGGLQAERVYTLVFSNHVQDAGERGLVADRFKEMELEEWWKTNDPEPAPGEVRERKKTKDEAPPKAVTTVTFKTGAGGADDAGGSR